MPGLPPSARDASEQRAQDIEKQYHRVTANHEKLIEDFHKLRQGRHGHPVVSTFVDDHIARVVRRLAAEYAALAIVVPHNHEFHAWLLSTEGDLKEFARQLPKLSPAAAVRYLHRPILWLLGGGGATVVGFKLSHTCLCYLAKALFLLVPLCLIYLLVPASRKARGLLQEKSAGYEQRLAALLEVPLHREMPWDLACMAATAAWFLLAPSLFRHVLTFSHVIFALEALWGLIAVVATGKWLTEGGARRSYL
jgi:hypothetical protein